MKKIDKIRIQNFKAFPEFQEFDLKGKNLLIYGNNGSGKSSLYWALYTLLQSCEKTVARVNDYFVVYDETNDRTFESLRNIFSQEPDSFIEIELQGEPPIRIAHGNIGATQTANVKEANKASDFINYKLLHNFYNSTHKSQLNIWSVFKHDIFPYFSENNKTYLEWLDDIESNVQYDGRTRGYSTFLSKISSFNTKVEELIGKITMQANKVLREKFDIHDILIKLEYIEKLTWSGRFNIPSIKMYINVKKNGGFIPNHRPQSFLNEAALTRIAISIRLGALLTRLSQSDWKILVLDDMLISLDMSNRMIISKIILEDNDLSDFQKIILTHDKGFFDILKSKTDSSEWEYLEFYKDEKMIGSKPEVVTNKSYLKKAEDFFEQREFDACANYLRKEAETILKRYLNKDLTGIESEFESLSQLINQARTQVEHKQFYRFQKIAHKQGLDIDKLVNDFENDATIDVNTKGRLRALKNELLKFAVEENKRNNNAKLILNELESIKKRILNPGSHGNSMPLYEQELKDAIQTVEQLHVLLNPTS
ncbi:ABC-type antimicrobial peptide transport system ATPase subunit [Parabacteroides sp. PF5-5]|uniref:AAA family ATPase n=1 Tax=unclassified Parabacteroides TaxID=2649774 RepID=UPI0024751F8B|nr:MULTISPECIES: AAA family ATPase [unclassified Parabacteroides]MDH6304214.1 ABC-type antimicrobial peptide transport system ATPase subunit [Parabacteroides sp. PH5-39]MDH6315071.1 AAA15 family ATPase/GTPase [Parabacteroides sp. PF5-13]MDH6318731.1 AAA15 family ATPase/GTPase [Parabacteroides sp. PH5-13]MDH6322461.1 ABC-type antimicrobial peptide transport system ATPase subunit [Parabacteroides sp. PH5-8]MDH6326404.1 ABC-type antimicrobial peptide transport system ATPase subunit [Parabacteroid